MKVYRFKVSYTGSFPLDMLRYDGCHPARQSDVNTIHASIRFPSVYNDCDPNVSASVHTTKFRRIVQLVCHGKPTEARWESFGCKVFDLERG